MIMKNFQIMIICLRYGYFLMDRTPEFIARK